MWLTPQAFACCIHREEAAGLSGDPHLLADNIRPLPTEKFIQHVDQYHETASSWAQQSLWWCRTKVTWLSWTAVVSTDRPISINWTIIWALWWGIYMIEMKPEFVTDSHSCHVWFVLTACVNKVIQRVHFHKQPLNCQQAAVIDPALNGLDFWRIFS